MKALRRFKGVAAVELAFLLIPLVIMTFGMVELGRAFYYYNGLVKSARDASRYLSMHARGETEKAHARCLAVYGVTTTSTGTTCDGSEPLVYGLETSMVKVDYQLAVPTGYGSIDMVTVTIEGFPFPTLTSFPVAAMVFGPISSTMRQGSS